MENTVNSQSMPAPEHKRIRALRRQLELTQLDVAIHTGVSQSQLSLFEQGYIRLAPGLIQRIWGFLKLEPYEEALNA